MEKVTEIKIVTPYLTLGQLLKLANVISNGGEAKFFLANNRVLVNGEEEARRGRKLYPLDEVTVTGATYRIVS